MAERGIPVAVEHEPYDGFVVAKLDELASWCRKNSLWPMPFATACCGIELMATGASKHDIFSPAVRPDDSCRPRGDENVACVAAHLVADA